MSNRWNTILWMQFGAAIDMFGDALRACPDDLWRERLWDYPGERPEYAQFWYIAYHTLFWLDLYLSGAVEGFLPPEPYTLGELDPAGLVPDRPYAKTELLAYLDHCRWKCRSTLEALTDESAQRPCRFGWGEVSFLELCLYNMRHVQEHGAQLNLLLGQQRVTGLDWTARARNNKENQNRKPT